MIGIGDPSGVKMWITMRGGTLCLCSMQQYKDKDKGSINSVVILTPKLASSVAKIAGFYPREGDIHHLSDEEKVKVFQEVVTKIAGLL